MLDKRYVQKIYDQRAHLYDQIVRILALGQDSYYRRIAIKGLELRPGDKVLDFGCGTGLNFRYISKKIGRTGHIVGTDYSNKMLIQSSKKSKSLQSEVSLIQHDDNYPVINGSECFDKILSTYTLTTLNYPAAVIKHLCSILKPGGKIVISDDLLPPGWFLSPSFFIKGLFQTRIDMFKLVKSEMKKYFSIDKILFTHFGTIYIIYATRHNFGQSSTTK